MNYIEKVPLVQTPATSDQPLVQRFAGETSIQPANFSNVSQRSKYLTQGKDLAEDQRKKTQEALDAFTAAEPGGSASNSSIYGQIQIN